MYWLTGLAGLLLYIAPWILSYSNNITALWTSIILGIVVVIASLWKGLESREENWEYWVAGITGILIFIAPFVLGFGSVTSAMWTALIMGAVIAILDFNKLLPPSRTRY